VTERKLAICKSAIEKNSRSIELAVKRLELSKDLLDSKTLDQQWKELIFVYPENVALWKRYLLFVQTFYIRFSIVDTLKAYRTAILKLRQQQQYYTEHSQTNKQFELEHGILDILGQLLTLLLQSGHTEKGVALCQALIEFNLFAPNFSSPGGYDFDDKITLFEPFWEKGAPRVGEDGASGWASELNRMDSLTRGPVVSEVDTDWEDEILVNSADRLFGETWLEMEVERDRRGWKPWKDADNPPEDKDCHVDSDFIAGYIIEFTRWETKFRLFLLIVRLLGLKQVDRQFANLASSTAMQLYLNADQFHSQNFYNPIKVLRENIPNGRTNETMAIFVHNLFSQCYSKFQDPWRTQVMLMWLEFEAEIIRQNKAESAKDLKKDLKKLVRCLLKEDRNNLELVVKFAELEFEMEGYSNAHPILMAAVEASNSNFFKQNTEDGFLSVTLLYRAAVELELKEIIRIQKKNTENPESDKSDTIHRNRMQWLLVNIGCGKKFSVYTEEKKSLILALVEGAQKNFSEWILEDIDDISCSRVFEMAPRLRHSIADVVFFHAWLTKFCAGTQEAVAMVQSMRDKISDGATWSDQQRPSRFDQLALTKSFLVESLDKTCLDLLAFHAQFDVAERRQLRSFYNSCISRHAASSYFQKQLVLVQDSVSIVSPIWQQVLSSIQDKHKTNLALIEEACEISVTKFLGALDPDNPMDISAFGYSFLYKLSNLLERCVTRPFLKHSPLIWRLLLWCASIDCLRRDSKIGCENIKVMLYRALQDVPWCKALYLDTALYLAQIKELTTTRKNAVVYSDGEEAPEDAEKFVFVPGTLEHINELMVEKDIRVRLPLQELEVLLEPLE